MWVDYLIRCLRDLAEASNMRTDLSALDLGNSSMKITKVGRKRVGRSRKATDSTSEDVILGKGFEDIVEDVHCELLTYAYLYDLCTVSMLLPLCLRIPSPSV